MKWNGNKRRGDIKKNEMTENRFITSINSCSSHTDILGTKCLTSKVGSADTIFLPCKNSNNNKILGAHKVINILWILEGMLLLRGSCITHSFLSRHHIYPFYKVCECYRVSYEGRGVSVKA
jgi:hypothetical protein